MPIANLDAYKQHRYQQLLQRIASVQAQMRSLRANLQHTLRMLINDAQIIAEAQALDPAEYLLPAGDSPKADEFLRVARALLSYAHYAGLLDLQTYQAMTGEQNPVPPDQISAEIDAWVRD